MSFLHDFKDGIFILHENPDWIPPFADAFERANIPFYEWRLGEASIDLSKEPPNGIFWNRLSASSPTRGNAHAKEYARSILSWLESYGRRIVNAGHVIEFEVSKVRQYALLAQAGFQVPKSFAIFQQEDVIHAAKNLGFPLIVKHNQGGKGIGVRRFLTEEELLEFVQTGDDEPPVDGIYILQEYVASREPFITRLEFIGGRFHYAVRVDTSAGSFELCPADACALPGSGENNPTSNIISGFAPATCEVALPSLAGGTCQVGEDIFTLRADISADDELVCKLEAFFAKHHIEVAGVEFIETSDNRRVIYDINTNTNYNSAVEEKADMRAADRVVAYLQEELSKITQDKK